MANVERLTILRDFLSENPDELNMLFWEHRNIGTCHTTRCVAGWALYMFDQETYTSTNEDYPVKYFLTGMNLLDLSLEEAETLFYCRNDQVVGMLDELIQEYSN